MSEKTEEEVDPYILQPFTLRIIKPGTLYIENEGKVYNGLNSLKYNLNDLGWVLITSLFPADGGYGEQYLHFSAGDVVQFIGEGTWSLTNALNGIYWSYTRDAGISNSDYMFDVEGNVTSLYAGDDFATITEIPNYALYRALYGLFGNFSLRDVSNLRMFARHVGKYALYNLHSSTSYGHQGDFRKFFNGIESVDDYAFTTFFPGYSYGSDSISAVKLPNVNSYAAHSFRGAFLNNIKLIWAELPSTTDSMGTSACATMFRSCAMLSFIDCRVSEYPSASNASLHPFYNWVNGVYAYGCFLKHPDAVWSRGSSGIPTNWEVFDYTTDWKFGKTLTESGTEVEQLSHVITPWISISSNCTSIKYTLPTGNYSGSVANTVFGKDAGGNEYYIGNFTKGGSDATVNLPTGTIALKFVLLISSVPTTWVKESTSGNYLWKGCKVT